MAVLCVDASASTITCVGYDDDGREAVVVHEPTRPSRPAPDWVELDMAAQWGAAARAIHAVALASATPVELVAVTGADDGCWLVDEAGEPVGAAIMGSDGRAREIVDEWQRSGAAEVVWQINGALPAPGMASAILAWLHRHDPTRVDRATSALTSGGWLFHQLTGRLQIDAAGASVPFASAATGEYSTELLHVCAMPWAARLLPEVATGQPLAPLTAVAALQTGLAAGTPVVLAPPALVAAAIGCGAVQPGQACASLGRTLATSVVTVGRQHDRAAAGCTLATGLPGRSLRTFTTAAGDDVVQWANAVLGLSGSRATGVQRLLDLAATAQPGAGGLVFLPHLSPNGERAPFVDPAARGALIGLSLGHRREDVARAMLEGFAFLVRECLHAAAAHPRELRVSGRGSATAGWNQLIADVTGVPVLRTADSNAPARGAFVVAMLASGRAPTITDAVSAHVRMHAMFAPGSAARGLYADMAVDVAAIRTALSSHGQRLAAMRQRAVSSA